MMLPHLNSAHHMAMWLLRHPSDAENAVQDAFIKALKAFDRWHGENAKGWLLKIVRNTCMTKLVSRTRGANVVQFDTVLYDGAKPSQQMQFRDEKPMPEEVMMLSEELNRVQKALKRLPVDFYVVLFLREFEDQSCKQISDIIDVPIGTVMPRISRARMRLREELSITDNGEKP